MLEDLASSMWLGVRGIMVHGVLLLTRRRNCSKLKGCGIHNVGDLSQQGLQFRKGQLHTKLKKQLENLFKNLNSRFR